MKREITFAFATGAAALSFCGWALSQSLPDPPQSIFGIGGEPCSEYLKIYDLYQRVVRGERMEQANVVGAVGAFADFRGTFGGYLARMQMERGLRQAPFRSKEEAMKSIYDACTKEPNGRFIDVVDRFLTGLLSRHFQAGSSNQQAGRTALAAQPDVSRGSTNAPRVAPSQSGSFETRYAAQLSGHPNWVTCSKINKFHMEDSGEGPTDRAWMTCLENNSDVANKRSLNALCGFTSKKPSVCN